MPNNREEWDREHGRGGGKSSAQKLADQIKSSLGGSGHAAPTSGSHGSTVRGPLTRAEAKRPAPVKGEKDQADSVRTKIRMAAYQRKNTDAVNPHEPKAAPARSADKLAQLAAGPKKK